MKIDRVETFVLRQELKAEECFAYSQSWYHERVVLVCKITTDDGIVGWGEAFGPSRIHKTTIDTVYGPMIIGSDPWDSDVLWDRLYNRLQDHGQKGLSVEALSAIDIALWDIKGKSVGMPIYKLLGGGHREIVIPYATGMYRREGDDPIGRTVEEAIGHVNSGFSAIKLKIGFTPDYDLTLVRETREAVGSDVQIMVDANHGYSVADAIALGRKIERYDISWLEEPVVPEDIEGYAEVRKGQRIPVAGGEAEFTRYGFSRLIAGRGVDILQPDCTVTGGFSEVAKIAALASANHIRCCPHVWGSSIAWFAGLHLSFALPEVPVSLYPAPMMLECDRTANVFREKLAKNMPRIDGAPIWPPRGAGLGVEVDEELIAEYRIP